MIKKINIPIFLFLFLNSFYIAKSWKCGADKIKIKPGPLKLPVQDKRRRLINSYTPIKIFADYSNLRATGSINSQTLEQIKNLIDETCQEFQRFIKVEHNTINLDGYEELIKEQCQIDFLGPDYTNYLTNNDLIIFPSFDSTLGTSTLAAAGLCLYNSATLRPHAGVLLINPDLSFSKRNTHLYMKTLLFHELTHVLVFNPALMAELGMTTTRIFDGSFVTFVNSPKVLTAARRHFNCSTLNGVPLENQGGEGSVGSHWEARYMLGDYMISTDYIDNVLSDITLALFEDSGFYKVEYYSGGLFKYGKNMGCSFFDNKCIEKGTTEFQKDFCTNPGGSFCSRSRAIKGRCIINEYSDIPKRYRYFDNKKFGGFLPANYCPVSNIIDSNSDYYPASCYVGSSNLEPEFGETIGNSSFCFISSLSPSNSSNIIEEQAICYKVDCDLINKQIIVNIGSNQIKCPKEGGTITNPDGFKGSINCPEYSDICGLDSEDNLICNEMFNCINNKIETDVDTLGYFIDEDDYEKIAVRISSNKLIFNFYYFILLLICII